MNAATKRKIKNVAKTGGKYTLNGLKMAGKGVLSVTEIASRGIRNVAKDRNARSFIAKAGTIGATIAFPAPTIALAGMKYMVDNCVLGHDISAVEALMGTFRTTEKIMQSVLDVAAQPTAAIADEVQKLSKKGKDALDR